MTVSEAGWGGGAACDYRITANDWRDVSPPAARQPPLPAARPSSLPSHSCPPCESPSPAPPDAAPPETTPADRRRRRWRMSLPPVAHDISVAGMAERYERWNTRNFKIRVEKTHLELCQKWLEVLRSCRREDSSSNRGVSAYRITSKDVYKIRNIFSVSCQQEQSIYRSSYDARKSRFKMFFVLFFLH